MSRWFTDLSKNFAQAPPPQSRRVVHQVVEEDVFDAFAQEYQQNPNTRFATSLDSQKSKLISEITNLRDHLNELLQEVKSTVPQTGEAAAAGGASKLEITATEAKKIMEEPQLSVIVLGWNKCGHCQAAKKHLMQMRKNSSSSRHANKFYYLETEGVSQDVLREIAKREISAVPVILVVRSGKIEMEQNGFSPTTFPDIIKKFFSS